MLGLFYIALALFGCAFIIFAALTGFGDGDGDGGGEGGGLHFPLFSPLTLAILFASIGAFGLITRYGLGVGDGASVLLSVGGGLVTAYAVGHAAIRLMRGARGTSTIAAAAFTGATGEVTIPIPAGGVGEVMLRFDSQRHTGPARSADGAAIAHGVAVTVVRAGNTLVVSPARPAQEDA